MTFYLLRPCSGDAAFEALLKKQVKLNLQEKVGMLRENGYSVLDARIMLFVKKDEIEISIYPSARLLVKCQSRKEAERKATEIFEILGINTPL